MLTTRQAVTMGALIVMCTFVWTCIHIVGFLMEERKDKDEPEISQTKSDA